MNDLSIRVTKTIEIVTDDDKRIHLYLGDIQKLEKTIKEYYEND